MRLIDLFSGIGGFSLAASWAGIKPVQFVENDEYCQKVLKKNFPEVPIHGDIKTFKGSARAADIVSGGFPCQPFSVAGQQRGSEDDRYLWPEMLRVINEVRPTWIIGENVAGIINMELDNVLSDLESEGYETQAFIIPACAVDAPHRRDRVWIVANAECGRRKSGGIRKEKRMLSEFDGISQTIKKFKSNTWPTEPDVGRMFDGFSTWLDGYGGLNATSKMEMYPESVCALWEVVLSQEAGICKGISAEKVLLAFVCKLKNWYIDEARIQLASKEAYKKVLLGLRSHDTINCPSCRSGQIKQSTGKHTDALQTMSRLLARHSEKAWLEYRRQNAGPFGWEEGIARTSFGIPRRVDRLRGLGNAIVPQVAFEIFRIIKLIEEGANETKV